ncbi:MAG: TonB family protein [Gammaproteobacteria bacterium]
MAAILQQPLITPVDRFGLTLCLAILVHGIIILGVTFAPEDIIQPRYETMEIILVQQESKPPEEAQFLAQANLEGGGDIEEALSPATPLPAPFPEQEPDITSPPPMQIQPPAEATPPVPEQVEIEPVLEPVVAAEQLAVESDDPEASLTDNKEAKEQEQGKQRKPMPETAETPPLPSATALLTNSLRIASLSAEIRRKLEAKAERPRRKFISASTKEYKYAAYMEAWRAKVERVGNLNYPDNARKRKLSGSLILDVALNADGSVNQITIRRSSGTKVLDDAAVRIVELSSPFAPFPDHIQEETDILHITRTWQFLNDNRFK